MSIILGENQNESGVGSSQDFLLRCQRKKYYAGGTASLHAPTLGHAQYPATVASG